MKKGIIFLIVVVLIFAGSCSSRTENEGQDGFLKTIMFADERFYYNENELIDKAKFIVLGEVANISFEVLNCKILESPDDIPQYEFSTIYEINVIELYKGDYKKTIKVIQPGGIEGYKEKEQIELIKNKKEYLFDEDSIKEIGDNWSIPIYYGAPIMKEGEIYLLALNEYGYLLNSNQALYQYKSENPFEEKDSHSTLSMYSILTELNVWDSFWAQWQKDNPNWETWFDKNEVDKILAEK